MQTTIIALKIVRDISNTLLISFLIGVLATEYEEYGCIKKHVSINRDMSA